MRGSKRNAQARLRKLLGELDSGIRRDRSSVPLSKFLRECLHDSARLSVSTATFEKYEEIIDKHLIQSKLGAIPLAKLRTSDVQNAYASWIDAGRMDGRSGGYSPATIRKFHSVLREALQTALSWELRAA